MFFVIIFMEFMFFEIYYNAIDSDTVVGYKCKKFNYKIRGKLYTDKAEGSALIDDYG